MAKKASGTATKPVKEPVWQDEVISFSYGGRKYREKIAGRLVLRDMSLGEIKDRLNDIPGKFAFWKSLQVTVAREIEDAEEEYDIWHATMYQEIVGNETKKLTETAIKNLILLENAEDYREHRIKIKELRQIENRINVLTKSYEMQSWTLRTIANLTATEMGNIEAHGKRSLADV